MSMFGATLECIECGTKSTVNGENLKSQVKYNTTNGESIWLTYFDCPKCGHRHVVQLDDPISRQYLAEVKECVHKVAKLKAQHKSIPAKLQAKYNKRNRHLDEYRKSLRIKWTGRMVTSDDGDCFPSLEVLM